MKDHYKQSQPLYSLLVIGSIIILSGILNYVMNGDYVSLGILFFAGSGFVLLGIKPKISGRNAERLNKYIRTAFFIALLILSYWFIFGYLKLFK
ncbi:MAG: hypothetical protein CSB06_02800 [Bacteroidia bacterium]|nr:MAG: hypothetical protein CSB06_02800 [Bacteroidia bacterium]